MIRVRGHVRKDMELKDLEIEVLRSSDRALDDGEFDPGSERTLAARFKHASRAASAAMHLERRTGE